jgi:DNA-binding NarL/FixJ family response regulator
VRAAIGEAFPTPPKDAALRALANPLVGRAEELGSLTHALDELDQGRAAAIELVGEPGMGKTRLLEELAAIAERRGHLVLSGSAAELERDLPFSVFVDALDEYVEGLEAKWLAALDEDVQAELAHVFPSLSVLARGREAALQHERYRYHRAVRELLDRLAARKPLVLVLDDVHWADSASVELFGALLRRPPSAAVLIAVACRPGKGPGRLAAALERARRATALTRIELGPLTELEARKLLGEKIDRADATILYEESGGNPFYLEQLSRSLEHAGRDLAKHLMLPSGIGVPSAVTDSLAQELTELSACGRHMLEGAAVAGDPFELELAAAAAGMGEAEGLDAVDELIALDLLRGTEEPRRFRFRHPLVRRAVYEGTADGWRLSAHERCADALAARGATAAACAPHVERCARQGDLSAVAVLRDAGEETARLAPASAAHWFAGAVRLLPQTAPAQQRVELLMARGGALTAAGYLTDSHGALLDALAMVPDDSPATFARLTRACAAVEHRLGHYEQAHARLVNALGVAPISAESVVLLVELALNDFYCSRYQSMHDWARRAVSAAEGLDDAALMAAALAMPALADSMTGAGESAQSHRAAAALVDSLSDEQLSRRIDAAVWLAAAELYLDRYAEADAHAVRALALARNSGQEGLFLVLYQILGRAWYVRGKLADAVELLDGAIEAARLLGNTQALVGNLFNRSVVAVAVGDLGLALDTAQESVELARDLDEGFVAAWAAVRLAGVRLESGQSAQAVELLLGSAGGPEQASIPGGWRSYCLELLTRCWLGLGRRDDAQRTADCAVAHAAAVQLPLAGAWAGRAAAAVALGDGDAARAAQLAVTSAAAAAEVHAPIEAALSRTLAGRAFAQAGRADRAVDELQRAAAELDECGALRYRDGAERELGKLGHRIHRRTRAGRTDGTGLESLTARELQVARLVVDRKTNPEIAAELFLSKKTVETHLRHIFEKMDVTSRVALAHAVERSEGAASAQGF